MPKRPAVQASSTGNKKGRAGRADPPVPPAASELRREDNTLEPSFSLRQVVRENTLSAWTIRIQLAEVAAAFLIFLGTVYIGYQANSILKTQNREAQQLGRQQYQAAMVQSYIASSSAAGFGTERERRMLRAALDLYTWLVEEDPERYRILNTSMPAISSDHLNELIEQNPADRDELVQLFARRHGALPSISATSAYSLVSNSPYHIVIGTFGNRPESIARATSFLERARGLLQPSGFRPYMNIVRNEDNFVLATLSGFSSRNEVTTALERERIRTEFPDAYASQSRGWSTLCTGRFEPCTPSRANR